MRRTGSTWVRDEAIQVSAVEFGVDQILCALWVDDSGRIHIVFYGDHDYAQNDTVYVVGSAMKYDAYYAYSTDDGQTFTTTKLAANPDNPAFALAHTPLAVRARRGEYVDIAAVNTSETATAIFTAFTGTHPDCRPNSPDCADEDRMVIWSAKITFP